MSFILFISTHGAEEWLSGISRESRKQVYFHTTTYNLEKRGDRCIRFVHFLLYKPNEGVAELDMSMLEGGVYVGNREFRHRVVVQVPPSSEVILTPYLLCLPCICSYG